MRVLHLPRNVASQISDTVQGMRHLGIETRGLALSGLITSNEHIELLPGTDTLPGVSCARNHIALLRHVMEAIDWADIVHWYCGRTLAFAFDVVYAHWRRKKMIVEFAGSDIRIPEIEAASNPYYAEVWQSGLWEYDRESLRRSRRHQRLFAKHGAAVLLPYRAMDAYVQPDIFPVLHKTMHRIFLPRYTPAFPEPQTAAPLVIHSPSKIHAKGTPAVLAAVEQLHKRQSFEFRLVHGMPYAKANDLLRQCDVYLDQFVLGAHGVAALEAMACGKPVVCYIKPSLMKEYPPDLPIVNATKETLPDVLAKLIEDGEWRAELGRRGRAYVEKHHDAVKLSRELLALYETL